MQNDLYNACQDKIEGKTDATWAELAQMWDIPTGKILKDRFYRAKAKQLNKEQIGEFRTPDSLRKEDEERLLTLKLEEDGTQVSDRLILMSDNDSKSPDFVLNAHGYDPEQWVLVTALSNFWNGMRPKDAGLVTLRQSKITVRPKVDSDITFEDVENFFSKFEPKSLSQFSTPRQYALGGLVLEVALMDVHVGNESLSFEELKGRVEKVVSEVKRKTVGLSLEKIILVQGGDIFHFDGYTRTTTSGTLITYGSDTYTMFDNGLLLMTWVINELSSISKVEVINIYGNHDKSSSYMLGKTLEAGFKSDPNVEIDTTHEMRKFRKIGNTSVAWIHGDMPKSNVYGTFQKEARKLFGETLYSEAHLGHLHHDLSNEKDGVIYRWLPSVTIPDQWHKDSGYTGAKQGTQCFLWDTQRDGHVDIWMIPVHD